MYKKLPFILLYSRIPAALLLPVIAYLQPLYYTHIIMGILVYGVVSDFFDGYTARLFKVSTTHLRKADSNIDQLFWIAAVVATYLLAPAFYHTYIWHIGILVGLEVLAYVISLLRFRNVVATHAILSKFWVVTMLATLIQVVYTGHSGWIFMVCFWVGVVSRLEIIAIMLLLRSWVNDVPGLYHALLLRKGKAIKRNKIFNG